MKIGAHVSTAGGVDKAIDRAEEIGAEAVQIFASSPRTWRFRFPQEEEVILFREKSEQKNISLERFSLGKCAVIKFSWYTPKYKIKRYFYIANWFRRRI